MLKKINLKNKTALVTGAGKGLGKACSIALAEAGAKVIILSRTKSDLIKVNQIIKKTKGSSQLFVCDVTNLNDLKKVLRKINRLDILVNNAGNNRPQHFTKISQENMEYLTNLNMKAAFNVAQLCSQKMVKAKNRRKIGKVILVNSIARLIFSSSVTNPGAIKPTKTGMKISITKTKINNPENNKLKI